MTRTHKGWTLAITSIGFFMVALDALVVMTALPRIRTDLHAGIATLDWTVNAYALTTAAGIITAAALGDRFGRRRVFTFGIGLFTLASAACAVAATPAELVAARAVQGVGAAIVIPLSLTLLTSAFPPARRAAIVGIWGGIAGIAVASGPIIGGAITQSLSWHWIFWVNVPVGLLTTFAARARLVEARGPAKRLDPLGAVLATGAAAALIWTLVRAASVGWGHAAIAYGGVVSAVLLAALVLRERRASAPMLPPHLFANRSFVAANVASLLMTAALMAAVFLTTQYFQAALGFSPLDTGVRLLPWTATPLVVAPAAGALADRIGSRPILASGLALQGIGLMWFGYAATRTPSYLALAVPLVVAGVGISMALPTAAATVLGSVARTEIGTASGIGNTMQRFGGALGIAVVSTVFTTFGGFATPASIVAGFRPSIVIAAGFSLVGAVAALATARQRAAAPTEPARPPEPVLAGTLRDLG